MLNKMRETFPNPNFPREVRLNKVILVMKGRRTGICSLIILSSVSGYCRNQKMIEICSIKVARLDFFGRIPPKFEH